MTTIRTIFSLKHVKELAAVIFVVGIFIWTAQPHTQAAAATTATRITTAGQYVDSQGLSHDVEVWSVINTKSGGKDYFVLLFPKVGSSPYPVITQVDGYNVFPSPPSANSEDALWTDRVQRGLPNYDVSLSPQDSIKTCSTPQCSIFVPGIASLSNLPSLMPHLDWALTNGYATAIAFARFYAARDTLTDIYGITNTLEALKNMPSIDGNRIGITGGSRGGHLSIHPLANPERPLSIAASVPEYGWVDGPALYDFYYNILPQIQPSQLLAQSQDFAAPGLNRLYKAFGTDINGSAWQQVTINRVASTFNTPVLLLHGSDDLMIPVAQANNFYASLKNLGKMANKWIYQNGAPPYATKSAAEGAHGILDANSSVKKSFLARNFFLQHMPPDVSEVVYRHQVDVDLIAALSEFRNAITASPAEKQNISELIIQAANSKIKYISSDSRIPTGNGPTAIAAGINAVWANQGINWNAGNVIDNLRSDLLPGSLAQAQATTLTISGDTFKLNGQAKFLVLAGYFDGLDSPDPSADLDYLKSKGIDGIRIFPNWWNRLDPLPLTPDSDPLITSNGSLDQGKLSKLISIVDAANSRGMIVDISFAREVVDGSCTDASLNPGVLCKEDFKTGVVAVTVALRNKTNVFYDLSNEHDYGGINFPREDVVDLKNRIENAVGTGVILSVSSAEPSGPKAVEIANGYPMDIVNVHFASGAELGSDISKAKGAKPAYNGEPYNTRSVDNRYSVQDLIDGVVKAKRVGLAAWTFHTDDNFILNGSTLANAYGSKEKSFLNLYKTAVDSAPWGVEATPTVPRIITYVDPLGGPRGSTVKFTGTNLNAVVNYLAPNGIIASVTASVNSDKTLVTAVIPQEAMLGVYVVAIGPSLGDLSNQVNFTVTSGPVIPNPNPNPNPEPEPNPEPSPQPTPEPTPVPNPFPKGSAKNPVSIQMTGTLGVSSAYSFKDDTILVAAHNRSNSDDDIDSVLLSGKDLTFKGPITKVDQAEANRLVSTPRVIYNPDLDKFLVAWEDSRLGNKYIFARFVSATGIPEGSDFQVAPTQDVTISDIDYDNVNKKYLLTYEVNSKAYFKLINTDGTLANEGRVTLGSDFEAKPRAAFNPELNEFWFTLVSCSGKGTTEETCKIVLTRMNAQSLGAVGTTEVLSLPHNGKDIFDDPGISYDSKELGAMIVWVEKDRDGDISSIFGRSKFNSGDLANEYVVLNSKMDPNFNPYSSYAYSSPVLNYNPNTKTFLVSSGSFSGSVMLTELDIKGTLLKIKEVITPPVSYYTFPTNNVSSQGGAVFASKNGAGVSGVLYNSSGQQTSGPSRGTGKPVDVSTLPKLINQIYVWSLGIASLLALLMMVLGSYYYMTSQGNAEQAGKGKDMIIASLMGIVLLFSAYLLLNTINPDLVNLRFKTAEDYAKEIR